ncbi:MAG: hypothetical protein ACK5LE_09795 [Alphaproteobacteria bacterium]
MASFKDKIEYRQKWLNKADDFKRATQLIDVEQEREALLLWAKTSVYKDLPEDEILQRLSLFPDDLNQAFFIGNAMLQDVVIFGEPIVKFAETFAKQRNLPYILLDEFMEYLICSGHFDK